MTDPEAFPFFFRMRIPIPDTNWETDPDPTLWSLHLSKNRKCMGKSSMKMLKYYYLFAICLRPHFKQFWRHFLIQFFCYLNIKIPRIRIGKTALNFQQLYAHCAPPCCACSCHSSSDTPCPLLAPAPPPSTPERLASWPTGWPHLRVEKKTIAER